MNNVDDRMRRFLSKVGSEDGVFSRAIAVEHGISDWRLRRGLAAGEWSKYRGGYLLAGARDSRSAQLRASVQHAGRRAAATGASALRVHGLELQVWDLCVTVPRARHIYIPDAIVLRDLDASEQLVYRHGLALVSQERALMDALRTLSFDDAKEVLFAALQQRWLTPERMNRWLDANPKKAGNPQVRLLREVAASGTHSEGEHLLAVLMTAAGITGWMANSRIYDEYGLAAIADFCFEAERVIIEFDGYAWHSDHDQYEHDRSRQNRLATGWTILRFTWTHLTEHPEYVIAEIKKALRQA